MKVAKSLGKRVTKCSNSLVKKMIAQNANSACIWLAHQPEFPKEAKKFRNA